MRLLLNKYTFLALALLLISFFANGQQSPLLPVKKNGLWGFIDTNATLIINYQYDAVHINERCNSFILIKDKTYGFYYNNSGLLIDPEYSMMNPINRCLNAVRNTNGQWGVLHPDSGLVIPAIFDSIIDQDNYCLLAKSNEKCSIYSYSGVCLLSVNGDSIITAQGLKYGYFRQNKLWGVVKGDQVIIEPRFDSIIVQQGYAKVFDTINQYVFVEDFDTLIVSKDKNIFFYKNALGTKSTVLPLYSTFNNGDYYIRSLAQSSVRIPYPTYPFIQGLDLDGYFLVSGDNQILADSLGNIITGSTYESIQYIGDSLFKMYKKNAYVWLHLRHGVLSIPGVTQMFGIKDSIADKVFFLARNESGWIILDQNWKQISNGYFSVELFQGIGFRIRTSQFGLINHNGQIIIKPEYDYISYVGSNIFLVAKNGLQGLFSQNGVQLLPTIYLGINVNGRSIKATSESQVEFYRLLDNGSLEQLMTYTNFRSLNVISTMLTSSGGNGNRQQTYYRWQWDSVSSRFGVIDTFSRQYILPPSYDKIKILSQKKITLTQIEVDTIIYSIGGMQFVTNKLFGLVNDINHTEIVSPSYLFIFTDDFLNYKLNDDDKLNPLHPTSSNFARAIDTSGHFVLIDFIGKEMQPHMSYINRFSGGSALSWFGDSLFVSDSITGHKVIAFSKFYFPLKEVMFPLNDYATKIVRAPEKFFLQSKSADTCRLYRTVTKSSPLSNLSRSVSKNSPHFRYRYSYGDPLEDLILRYTNISISIRHIGFGFIDDQGQLITNLDYNAAENYCDGLALVKVKGKYQYINTYGEIAFNASYTKARSFSNGLAAVRIKKKWGYINTHGDTVIAPDFSAAGPFSEGMAAVKKNRGFQYIDENGNIVIENTFLMAGQFKNGLAVVRDRRLEGLIDRKGEFVQKYQFVSISDPDANGNRLVLKNKKNFLIFKTQRYALINAQGNRISGYYRSLIPTGNNLYTFKKGKKYGLINNIGKKIIPSKSKHPMLVNNGLAVIKHKKYASWINIDTKKELEQQYRRTFVFSQGYAFALNPEVCVLVNLEGVIQDTLPIIPDSVVVPFDEYMCSIVKYGRKYSLINGNMEIISTTRIAPYPLGHGNYCIPVSRNKNEIYSASADAILNTIRFAYIGPYCDGLAEVKTMYKEGFCDAYGKYLVKPIYTDIKYIMKGIYMINISDKIGYIRYNGSILWEPSN